VRALFLGRPAQSGAGSNPLINEQTGGILGVHLWERSGNDRLFEDLRQQFAVNSEVEVLMDRRHDEQRQTPTSRDPERRRSDRREQ
jgi:hypothetical protein